MKKIFFALLFISTASNAYALRDLAFAEWAGSGEYTVNGETSDVQSSFLIIADPDGVEEKYFSWGLVSKELGIRLHSFWACFYDVNKFDIVHPIDFQSEEGEASLVVCPIPGETEEDEQIAPKKIGFGSCINMYKVGLLCDYVIEEKDYKIQETFVMKPNGDLSREGLFTKGETMASWEMTIPPKKWQK